MSSRRTRYTLDVFIALFLGIALVLELTGGFYAEPFGIRVSVRKPDRAFLIGVVLVLIRWWWFRSQEFLGRPFARYRELWQRVFQRGADPVTEAIVPWWHNALVLAAFAAIAGVMLQAQLRQMMSVADLGDPLFSIWRMGWVYHQMQGDPRALFDANIFHPTPLTFTLSESMLLPSLLAAPMFAAGVHPVVIYNILLLATFPLTGFATYLLLKRLTGSPAASFIGGLFYMCHPYRLEHYSHLEQLFTFWMPLALLALIRFGQTQRLKFALAAAVCAAAQLYSSMYYGVFLVFYAAVIGVALGLAQQWNWKRLIKPGLVASAVAVALIAPLARPYLAAQSMKGDRERGTVGFYSAAPADYFRPHPRLATHGGHWLPDIHPERALFPGVSPLVLSAVALVPPIGPIRAAFTAGLIVAYDMSRGMNGLMYPVAYETVPPVRGMRVAARFSILLGISLAVLAAYGARRLLSRWSGWRRRAALAAGVLLLMLDLRPNLVLYPVWPDIPRIYKAVAGLPDAVLAEFPFEQNEPMVTNELPYQYFSLWHWRQMVNGYSGFSPEGHQWLVQLMRTFPDDASIAALRTHGVTHITVNCAFIHDPCKDLRGRINSRAEFKHVEIAHWRGVPTVLYELVR